MSGVADIVSVSSFSRGRASSVFDRAQNSPVVVVRNNVPISVVVSVEEFTRMTRIIERLTRGEAADAPEDETGDDAEFEGMGYPQVGSALSDTEDE